MDKIYQHILNIQEELKLLENKIMENNKLMSSRKIMEVWELIADVKYEMVKRKSQNM